MDNGLNKETEQEEVKSANKVEIIVDGPSILGLWIFLTILFSIITIVYLGIGISKLNNITDAESLVGGAAYNYIIHSNFANGHLIISLIFAVLTVVTALLAIFTRLKPIMELSLSTINKK